MKNALTAIAAADTIMDGQKDAPKHYADALTAMVADGWADRLPMDAKGRPSGDRAAAIAEVQAAYKSAGVTGAPALRQRVLRLTYALHILAANGRREDEADDAYVTRVGRIRTIANVGDRAQVDKALAGSTAKAKRRGPNRQGGGKKGGQKGGQKGEETPKVVSPKDRYDAAHNALVAALSEYMDALAAYRADGGKVTKAASGQIVGRANTALAALAS